MSSNNLEPLAIELGETIELIKHLTDKKKELDAQVRKQLASSGVTQLGPFLFEITQSSGRRTLDKAALIADGINPDDYMKVGAPFTTMKCKRVVPVEEWEG